MEKTDILIFDVGLGQSIFIYPHSNQEYGMLIDCGNTEGFEPIDFLLEHDFLPNKELNNLTLTNYDQDHFSGMPHLLDKVKIKTVNFAKNLTSSEIKDMKDDITEALEQMCDIKDSYIYPAINHNPPYVKKIFHLDKQDLDTPDTNNLSQIVFVEHYGSVICISGDLEETGWKTLLAKDSTVKEWLKRTNVFVASHHGRENGYCVDIFSYCKPECIVISDKGIEHETQRDMCSIYGKNVAGNGVYFNRDIKTKRKVLTTRDDGHVWLQLHPGGARIYRSFTHE